MVDLAHDVEMFDLRVLEDFVDGIYVAARYTGVVEDFDPMLGGFLLEDLLDLVV